MLYHPHIYEYETNVGISALTGGLTWRRGPTVMVSRKRSLSQNRNRGKFHPNIIIPCSSSLVYDTAPWKRQLRSVVVCRVRSKMSPCSCLAAGDTPCYDLLNKVQSYFSNREGSDDREAGFSAWNTNATSSASVSSLSRTYAHQLKVTFHMEKTCEKYQVLKERAPRESNFSVWYNIEYIFDL